MSDIKIEKCVHVLVSYDDLNNLCNMFGGDGEATNHLTIYKYEIEEGFILSNFATYFDGDIDEGLNALSKIIDEKVITLLLTNEIDFISVNTQ